MADAPRQPLVQTILAPLPTPSDEPNGLEFMGGGAWRREAVKGPYVPRIGTLVGDNEALALAAGCGRGKSTACHDQMRRVLKGSPGARILLIGANIVYSTNLAHELVSKFPDHSVGVYLETKDLAKHQIIVCSTESIYKIKTQQFEFVLVDEVRTVAGLTGGGTMSHQLGPVFVLRKLCALAKHLVFCDADLFFKSDDTEATSLGEAFTDFIARHEWPVVGASMVDPAPEHLQRSVRIFYDCKQAAMGRAEWMDELRAAAAAWRRDPEKRIAVSVGSRERQVKEVVSLLRMLGVPWTAYSGDTGQGKKYRELKDPDRSWVDLGAVVFTTTLGVGVDPKTIRFARVFVWTSRCGCNMVTNFQGAMRFGRAASAPLDVPTFDVLLDCRPPHVVEARIAAGKEVRPPRPTFQKELAKVRRHRAMCAGLCAAVDGNHGGPIEGARPRLEADEELISILAHINLERRMQGQCHHELAMRIFRHHGWPVVQTEPSRPTHIDPTDAALADDDTEFATLTRPLDKMVWVLKHVREHGEAGFFFDCYGLVCDHDGGGTIAPRTGRELCLVSAYWALRKLGRLPSLRPTCHQVLQIAPTEAEVNSIEAAHQALTKRAKANSRLKGTDRAQKLILELLAAARDEACARARGEEVVVPMEDVVHVEDADEDDASEGGLAVRLVRAADQILELTNGKVRKGVDLCARRRCISADAQERSDRVAGLDGDRKRKCDLVPTSAQMRAAEACEHLLGASLTEGGALPQSVVDIANRQKGDKNATDDEFEQRMTYGDRDFVRSLCRAAEPLVGTDHTSMDLRKLLGKIADAHGLMLDQAITRPGARGAQRAEQLAELRFEVRLPEVTDDWMVYSSRLGCDARVREWAEAHAGVDEEDQMTALAADLDDDMWEPTGVEGGGGGGAPEPMDVGGGAGGRRARRFVPPEPTRDKRVEKIDGRALERELERLSEWKREMVARGGCVDEIVGEGEGRREARWSAFLEEVDARAMPQRAPGAPPPRVRYLVVAYGKRRGFGRRTASRPSMQECPSGLRRLLVGVFCHDIDIVNCHPTLFLQVARKMGVPQAVLEPLVEYTTHRDAVLARIGEFYGVAAGKCKYAVLRVLNLGRTSAWVRDAKCTRNVHEEQVDLLALEDVARAVRDAFFAKPELQPQIEKVRREVKVERAAALREAREHVERARSLEDRAIAKKRRERAIKKARDEAINRTVFSHCVFELEDQILDVIDRAFASMGRSVYSLIFDGLTAEHREGDTLENGRWVELEELMRHAEAMVKIELGYTIELMEKPLFHENECAWDSGECDSDGDDERDDESDDE